MRRPAAWGLTPFLHMLRCRCLFRRCRCDNRLPVRSCYHLYLRPSFSCFSPATGARQYIAKAMPECLKKSNSRWYRPLYCSDRPEKCRPHSGKPVHYFVQFVDIHTGALGNHRPGRCRIPWLYHHCNPRQVQRKGQRDFGHFSFAGFVLHFHGPGSGVRYEQHRPVL